MRFVRAKKNDSNLKSKFLILLSFVILIFFIINFVKTWSQNHAVDQEIGGLKGQIADLQTGNSKLNDLIKYFNSDAYVEEKAREDLGLKKQGENVVVIADQKLNDSANPVPPPAAGGQPADLSNPQKWWQHFFN